MLLIPIVSSFMVAVVIVGFNMATVVTAGLMVYYAGRPLVQVLQQTQFQVHHLDIFLFTVYATLIGVLVMKVESATAEFDRSFTEMLVAKDIRIQELEMQLKKRSIEDGPPGSLTTAHHRLCTPPLFSRDE
jgi:hypothetical protein